MREFKLRPSLLIPTAVMMVAALFIPSPLQAQSSSPAVAHIQSYYQQLMPTIQQAGRLTVRERDKRFTPAISSAFDLATMTRLAVGPAWTSFSAGQQMAVRDAFAQFIIADYASQVSDYSGESFVVEPNAYRSRVAAVKLSRQSCCSLAAGLYPSIIWFVAGA